MSATQPPAPNASQTPASMNDFWKYVLNGAAVILAITAFVVAAMTSALLGILMLTGSIFTGCIANDKLDPTAAKWLSIALWVLMLPFLFVGSATNGAKVKWQMETSNAALPRPKKKEEIDKRTQHEKNLEFALRQIVENTGKILENQGNAKQEENEIEAASKKGREDAERDFENGDTSKMKQIPQTEQTLPQIVLPEDIPGEAIPQTPVPKKKVEPKKPAKPAEPEAEQGPPKGLPLPTDKEDMPQGTPIPNTSPKDPTPELRAKIAPQEKKKGRPTFVVCCCKNCEDHKHPITGWHDFDKNGVPEPLWDPCFYAETGKAACRFKEFAWE